MIFETRIPRTPLNEFVDFLWFYSDYTADHLLERVLPDGSMELIINLHNENRHTFDPQTRRPRQSYRRSWLSGPHSEFIVIDTVPDASMIGVHFRPGGAAALFDFPLSEMRNGVVDLETIWNRTGTEMRDRLLEAPTPAAKFEILETTLLSQYRDNPGHRAVEYALQYFRREPESVTIGKVTTQIGLSPRRFIEVFTERIGMTPKIFCRLQRFQRAIGDIHRRCEVRWAELATGCGYYDQAHFINDFKGFCGVTPGDYLRERPEYPNFLPIRD